MARSTGSLIASARQFSLAIMNQVLLSGTSFAVSFLLIRRTTNADYAKFVLVQTTIALLVAAQSASGSGPLAVVALRRAPERRREMVGAIRTRMSFLVRRGAVALLALVPATYFLLTRDAVDTLIVSVGIVAAWAALEREFLRSVLLMYRRPGATLRSDLAYASMFLGGSALAAWGLKPAAAWAVGGVASAALCGAWVSNRSLAADPGWVRADAAPVWAEMKPLAIWSVTGAVIYVLFTQSFNYMLAARLSLTAVAEINATRLLLMPPMVLTIGVSSLMVPTAAAWLAERGFIGLIRRLIGLILVLSSLDILYFVAVWFGRNWLTADLLHKVIADRDRLILLWAAVAFIGLLRDVFQATLFALGHQRTMAGLSAAGALVALPLMWFGMPLWGTAAALIGQIAGELVNLAGLIGLAWKRSREYSLQYPATVSP